MRQLLPLPAAFVYQSSRARDTALLKEGFGADYQVVRWVSPEGYGGHALGYVGEGASVRGDDHRFVVGGQP